MKMQDIKNSAGFLMNMFLLVVFIIVVTMAFLSST